MKQRTVRPSTGPILENPDVVLIGGGIMSATLGIMLKRLSPQLTIQIVESLPRVALESSHAWNNAGTGHAALCELNYTPQKADGSVDVSKAMKINEQFENSKHFWARLVDEGVISDPSVFIKRVPHMSFVHGEADRDYLKARFDALKAQHLFGEMQYSEDPEVVKEWAPLLWQGRPDDEMVAATRVESGTDINFGALTQQLIDHLISLDGVELAMQARVTDISQAADGQWKLKVDSEEYGKQKLAARFAFIGAGGGSLHLLQKSGIPEGKGFGGFPVSGQFLVCTDHDIIERHAAKVYGKAAVGAPPMSVPHLDTRVIDGRRALLFGPYAGFSPKFLKEGSMLDLIKSVKLDNILPLLTVGRDNMDLTQYLINEVRKSHSDRVEGLREFFPDAKEEDWKLVTAGQRVQIIKKNAGGKGGKLEFGTEVVAAQDGSIAALLGASPGASTSVSIIVEVLEKCFPEEVKTEEWQERLSTMLPAYGKHLAGDEFLYRDLRDKSDRLLKID
ncbi:malate dehydrogenase (quinone) [Pelagicoccus sp. SDUM812002]|uniref:malate dehydrogenase (quinone) n=1 Tax=Pelagicoccus sp. SDUM812002 TaxID=3041266 RepID=UPI00280D9C98|nr:malate dehydrogenase (quinone) [Pelagicoccus sp. SDUM812002]MDQ8187047.1 malate dehydrogenase (quinone) [Pelagicoccus sp. SDUM812002]